VIHYGSSVFEGRCAATPLPSGPAIFSSQGTHAAAAGFGQNFTASMWISRFEELVAGMAEVVKSNGVFAVLHPPHRGCAVMARLGVNPFNSPTEVYICNYPWGKISDFGFRGRCRRMCILVDSHRPQYFAGDGQVGRELHEFAAHQDGSRESTVTSRGLPLTPTDTSAKARGENVFVVRNGVLNTAPLGNSVLPRHHAGFSGTDRTRPGYSGHRTRASLAKLLYIADEVFFTGTGCRSHTHPFGGPRLALAKGVTGPITKAIQKEFYAIINGEKTGQATSGLRR